MEILSDFTTSVERALEEIDHGFREYPGLVICGTHTPTREMIDSAVPVIKKARISSYPFLGICWGHQVAAIEYARNVLNIHDATTEELGEGTWVVKRRKEGMKIGLQEGESYWSNYDVAIEWDKPKNFITVPYHPEYQSSKNKPHPVLIKFLNLCKNFAAV